MKNPLFAFGACLRHAFMAGVGYDDFSRIDETDQRRWANYDPPEVGAFATMAEVIAAYNRETVVDGEPEKVTSYLHPNVLSGWNEPTVKLSFLRGKDLEFMWKSIRDNIPVGSIWQHVDNRAYYRVTGLVLNTITDEWDVEYVPLYTCRVEKFTRQATSHDKAFIARFAMADDGSTYADGRVYPERYAQQPKEKEADE